MMASHLPYFKLLNLLRLPVQHLFIFTIFVCTSCRHTIIYVVLVSQIRGEHYVQYVNVLHKRRVRVSARINIGTVENNILIYYSVFYLRWLSIFKMCNIVIFEVLFAIHTHTHVNI